MTGRNKRLLFATCGVVAVLIVSSLPVVFSSLCTRSAKCIGVIQSPVLSLTDFLNVAVWVQALIAWITLIVIAIGAYQIWLLKRQTELAQEGAEREAYLPLISHEVQSTKKLLYSKGVREALNKLRSELTSAEQASQKARDDDQVTRERFDKLLADVRIEIDSVAALMTFPLLGNEKVSFDHIEALINLYNYLSKGIEDGRLRREFATDLGVANFKVVYQLVLPIIDLRRKISPKYASHFIKYCGNE
jgi:hypothetical protein